MPQSITAPSETVNVNATNPSPVQTDPPVDVSGTIPSVPVPQSAPADQSIIPGNAAPATGAPTAPSQSGAPTVNPNQPHGRLLQMLSGLLVGVDSFATSAATKGREGGVPEVQQYYAKQQQQQLELQKNQRDQEEHDLRIRTMNANLLINQLQYQKAILNFPLEYRENQLKLQEDTMNAYKNEASTLASMGYDPDDPAQRREGEARIGIGAASQQPGAINIPFSAGQSTDDVMKALQGAVPAGKGLTDYTVLPSYNDGKHGTGGSITGVPNDSPLMTMPATPRQISSGEAEAAAALAKANALGLTDTPEIKKLQGLFDNVKSVIDKGGKPSTHDLFAIHQSILGPVGTIITGKSDADKLAKEHAEAQKAQLDTLKAGRPATLEEATANAVQTRQAYFKNPTQDNLQLMKAAEEQRSAAYQDKLDQVAMQASATAKASNEASGKSFEAMLKNGINPVTKEKLTTANAPDEFMIDTRTGNPIPTSMVSSLKPSMQETNRSDFANSTIHSLDQIDALRAAGKLPNGPLSGLTANILAKAGLASEDAQKAIDFISFAQSAATGAHVGGRFNKEIMQKMGSMIGMNMNDSQFTGAEDTIRSVMSQYVQQGGRYTVGQWNSMSPEDKKNAMKGTDTAPTNNSTKPSPASQKIIDKYSKGN